MLIHKQSEIVEDMFLSIKEKKLYNIPTGTGKTYILLALAKKIIQALGKKVIISTSTNQLVREFYDVSQKHTFNFKEDSVSIQIGKLNYIDYQSYLFYRNNKELEDYITEDSLQNYDTFIISQNKENLFLDIFHKIVKYKDIASMGVVSELLSRKTTSSKLFNSEISITNHFFLINSIRNVKDDFFDKYVVLMDETHLIGEVAQTTLSNDFSLFSTKISLSKIKQELTNLSDFAGKVAMQKNINTINTSLLKMLYSYSNLDNLNRIEKADKTDEYIQRVFNFNKTKSLSSLKKQIKKRRESLKSKEVGIFLKEIESIDRIEKSYHANKNYVSLSYTPSRGYPLLSSFSENPLGFLNRILWRKLKYFVGVSATISPSFEPNEKEFNYSLKRIGMLGQSKDIEFYEKFFPKELVKIYLPNKKSPEYISVYDENFNIENDPYHSYIIEYIHKHHHNKNSIIFCGGYKEANILAELYTKSFDDMKIHKANRLQTSTQTLEDFKQNGGLLFATRDYGIGVSLKGKLLENIFILRLPYPVATGFQWQMLKKKSMNFFMTNIKYEMLISLMQLLGRLQRSEVDSGSIHLLDKRYFTNVPLKKKIDKVLSYYGIIMDVNIFSKKKDGKLNIKDRKKSLQNLDEIFLL